MAEKNLEQSQSGQRVSGPRFEPPNYKTATSPTPTSKINVTDIHSVLLGRQMNTPPPYTILPANGEKMFALTSDSELVLDTCCPLKHYGSLQECRNSADNPCHTEAPYQERECGFDRSKNTDFWSIVLNRWNVSCACPEKGYEWDSRFGMCIGKSQTQ